MNKHIKNMRLKFFFVTAAICLVLISAMCMACVVGLHARNEENFREIEQNWEYNPDWGNPNPDFELRRESREAIMKEMRDNANKTLFRTVFSVGGGSLIILLVIAWFLAYWIVKPTKLSWQKQQRFIGDASHELKTPLAIISAGCELKNYKEIRKQVADMDVLISNLLALSKLDETNKIDVCDFDLSQVILTETLSFEGLAFERHKEIITHIEEDIKYKGNAGSVKQALKILLDNAIKYGKSKITVKLNKNTLLVENDCENFDKDELPYLFERFYRGSVARSATKGTGLGLAILKNICDINRWKAETKLNDNNIIFQINF
jgi:signal transduction histidine kinase